MLGLLMDFWFHLFNTLYDSGDYDYIVDYFVQTNANGEHLGLTDYLALLCSFISLIVIVWLCCMFIFKIIKLVGGLIR